MPDLVSFPFARPDLPGVHLEMIAWFALKDREAYNQLNEQVSGHVVPRHVPEQLFIFSGGAPMGYPEYERWQNRSPELGLAFRISSHALLTDLGWLWRDATILDSRDEWLRNTLEEDARRRWVDEAEATIQSGASEQAVAEALRFRSHASRYGLNDAAGHPVRPAAELIRRAPWFLPPRQEEQEGELGRHPDGWLCLELDEFHIITWPSATGSKP